MAGSFVFEQFVLDPDDRQLRRGADPVELNGRYFDALALLVREAGKLVSKDRFLDEVWRGVPVTEEALLGHEPALLTHKQGESIEIAAVELDDVAAAF